MSICPKWPVSARSASHAADRRDREGHRARPSYTADLGGAAHFSDAFSDLRCHASDHFRSMCPRARALEGVVAVVTGDDCKLTFGVLPIAMNEFPLAREKVRYRGEPIAAVAAIDEETAAQSAQADRVEYEELPAYFTPKNAHGARRDAACTTKSPTTSGREVHHEFGDWQAGLKAADLVREVKIYCSPKSITPRSSRNATLTEYDPDRGLLRRRRRHRFRYYLLIKLARCLQMKKRISGW